MRWSTPVLCTLCLLLGACSGANDGADTPEDADVAQDVLVSDDGDPAEVVEVQDVDTPKDLLKPNDVPAEVLETQDVDLPEDLLEADEGTEEVINVEDVNTPEDLFEPVDAEDPEEVIEPTDVETPEDLVEPEDAILDLESTEDVAEPEDVPGGGDISEPVEEVFEPDVAVCLPDCEGKGCGDNGCGGSCGVCSDENPCTIDGCSADQLCVNTERALLACDSPPCSVNDQCLYKVKRSELTKAERLSLLSLQGVTAQHRPAIWLSGAGSKIYPDELAQSYGVTFFPLNDLWDLVYRLSESLSGTILFEPDTDSQNVAMSLAGLLGGLAITKDQEEAALAAGLSLLIDVTGKDEAWCWENYGPEFNLHMLAEQTNDKGDFLLDYPIAQKAFIYFDEDCGDFRTQIALQLDQPYLYGWGAECGEYEFVKGASEGGASVVPSDWSSNLSVLSNVEGASVTGNAHAADEVTTLDEAHYVAIVMSDGDNIQFLQNAFNDPPWWGNIHRGDFPMGWEMSPVLSGVAPSILEWIYATATPNDQAIAGPSGAGYVFPSVHPDPLALAQKSAAAMKTTDMRIALVLDTNGGLEGGDAYVAQPEIDAVIYKDFADYNGLKGGLRWSQGKPIKSVDYLLWNNESIEDSPEGVAAAINGAPKNPKSHIGSYSIVNVHAWSEWPENPYGDWAMDAAKWTVMLLDPHVKVVSVEELFKHLKKNLQGVTKPPGPPSFTFEAETDLSHQMGYAQWDGWACNTVDQDAGHMCYGPYTKDVPAGDHTATYHLMVDVTDPPAANDKIVTLDIYDASSDAILAAKDVFRYDFDTPFTTQPFALDFQSGPGSNLEFRVFWHDTSYVNVDKVVVQ